MSIAYLNEFLVSKATCCTCRSHMRSAINKQAYIMTLSLKLHQRIIDVGLPYHKGISPLKQSMHIIAECIKRHSPGQLIGSHSWHCPCPQLQSVSCPVSLSMASARLITAPILQQFANRLLRFI